MTPAVQGESGPVVKALYAAEDEGRRGVVESLFLPAPLPIEKNSGGRGGGLNDATANHMQQSAATELATAHETGI